MKRIEPTAEDGRKALQGHLLDRALAARATHGPDFDASALERLLADTDVVRFPTRLVVDEEGALLPGEFAWARPRGGSPRAGEGSRPGRRWTGARARAATGSLRVVLDGSFGPLDVDVNHEKGRLE